MITKRLRAAYWENDKPAAHLLNIFSRGFDSVQLEKIAASDALTAFNIKPEIGSASIHLITTGAGEYYSANHNADYFNESSRKVKFPEGFVKEAMLGGGLEEYHSTFLKYGAVYRDHFNSKKGGTPEGEIVWEKYNRDMHRGELVIKVKEEKWEPELEKLAKEEPVYFSMGCGVPEDICSICSNRAANRSSYCQHLRFQKLAILEDGSMVFAYNDKPHFHDISLVAKPADRIAFGLQKVASATKFVEDEAGLYLPTSLVRAISSKKEADRYEILQKLAKLEENVAKNSNAELRTLTESFIKTAEEEDKIVKELKDFPQEKLFSSLINNNSMLTPNTFVSIVLKKKPSEVEGAEGFPKALKSIFSDLLENGDFKDLTEDGSYMPGISFPDREIEDKVKGLSESLSLNEEPVRHRIIKITVTGIPKMDKESMMDEPTSAAKYLAKEYAKYQLTFLANSKKDNMMLAVLQNQV